MELWTNNAEGGTPGTLVTVANSGGASGRPWNFVDYNATEHPDSLTFDSAVAVGTLAYKAVTDGSNTGAMASWSLPPNVTAVSGRMELFIPSPGVFDPDHSSTSDAPFMTYIRLGGLGGAKNITIGTSAYDCNDETFTTLGWHSTAISARGGGGTIHAPSHGTYIYAPEGTIPLDQWFRIEFAYVTTNPGTYRFAVYPDRAATTPTYERSGDVEWLDGSGTLAPWTVQYVGFGPYFPQSNYSFDNLALRIDSTEPIPPSSDGWIDLGGKTSSPLSFTAHAADDGKLYRAKYTSTGGEAVSTPAKLTVGPADWTPPDESGDWPIGDLPDAIAEAEGPGSATVLDLVRQFSAAVRRPVRIVGPSTIEMVDVNTPYLPTGFEQADAETMYHSASRTALAGEKTLSLEENDLALSATAELVSDDARLVASDWRLPGQLPCYGLRPTPVSRVSYTFTPDGCTGSVDFDFPMPFGIVRRS